MIHRGWSHPGKYRGLNTTIQQGGLRGHHPLPGGGARDVTHYTINLILEMPLRLVFDRRDEQSP